MKKIIFTIKGNQKSPIGNAVPKLKMTGKQKWTPIAQEYAKWKSHVVYSLLNCVDHEEKWQLEMATDLRKNISILGKPIVLGFEGTAHMKINIYWGNEAHGDPENIFGSIADALFYNDKHLSGEFHFGHDPGNGRVDVELTINE